MQTAARLLASLWLVLPALVCLGAALRCFTAEFGPVAADPSHTSYSYSIDVLAPAPVELAFPLLEFGPVLDNRCSWSGSVDALQITMNGVMVGYWPLSCHEDATLQFGVSTLGPENWGQHVRSPVGGERVFAPQFGRADMRTGTWSTLQAPSRWRNVTVALFSGSERAFMPSLGRPRAAAPLVVRTCVLEAELPVDMGAGSGFSEHEFDYPTVMPLASCVYHHAGRCGANLGYAVAGGGPVAIRRHASQNSLAPAYVENGWKLPELFEGARLPEQEPHMHVGWPCESGAEVHWRLNGSVLRLGEHSRACALSLYNIEGRIDAGQFGVSGETVKAAFKPLTHRQRVQKVEIGVAKQAWAAAGVQYPVVIERLAAAANASRTR